jgi:hypothetical protein
MSSLLHQEVQELEVPDEVGAAEVQSIIFDEDWCELEDPDAGKKQNQLHLKRWTEEEQVGRTKGFWQRFSVFQIPDLIKFKGKAEARILLYLYRAARGYCYYAQSEKDLSFPIRVETIAENTGISVASVKRALRNLEKLRYLKKENNKCLDKAAKDYDSSADRRRGKKGKFGAGKITLLNPETGEVLQTRPGQYAICQDGGLKPYLTIPSDALKEGEIQKMKNAELAVYLTALRFTSLAQSEEVVVSKKQLRKISGLGKHAFNRGFKKLKSSKLISYSQGILTVNDPKTLKTTTMEVRSTGAAI